MGYSIVGQTVDRSRFSLGDGDFRNDSGLLSHWPETMAAETLGTTEELVCGVRWGLDNADINEFRANSSADFLQGYEIGQRMREKYKPIDVSVPGWEKSIGSHVVVHAGCDRL